MKKIALTLLSALTLLACSDKKMPESTDTQSLEVHNANSVSSLKKTESTQSNETATSTGNFILDNLLSFDSEEELKQKYGDNVVGEVESNPDSDYHFTILFPDTKNQVNIYWKDEANKTKLSHILITEKGTDWKTKEGITIGTGVKELEKLNEKPFSFSGLDGYYPGKIDWQEGYFSKKKMSGSLEYPTEDVPDEFAGLLGEDMIESSSDLAQKADLTLRLIEIQK